MIARIWAAGCTLVVSSLVSASVVMAQNPYAPVNAPRYERRIPTFGAGSYQPPPTGNYSGPSNQFGNSQLSQTYPPAPRVRRPVISPYMNLSRPEGIVGGVPNYYSLVRPRVEAFNRYQQGVETFRRFEQDTAQRQQELYMQQQRDFESLQQKMREEQAASQTGGRPARTQYAPHSLRATGHATSFGVR